MLSIRWSNIGIGLALALLLLLSMAAGLLIGSERLPWGDVAAAVAHRLGFGTGSSEAAIDAIVWRLRLPRVLLAGIVRGGLAIIVVAYLTHVRRPLDVPTV